MSENPVDHPKNSVKRAKPVGRALRLIVGAVLLVTVVPWYLQAAPSFLLATLAVLLFLIVFYSRVHLLVTKTLPGVNRWAGALLANVPVIIYILGSGGGLIFGAGEGQLAALTYLGVSLVVTGLRSDAGCEVMAIPGLVWGDGLTWRASCSLPSTGWRRKFFRFWARWKMVGGNGRSSKYSLLESRS